MVEEQVELAVVGLGLAKDYGKVLASELATPGFWSQLCAVMGKL